MFPHQTAEVLDRGSGSSGNSVQQVHIAPDSGTKRPGGGRLLSHLDAHLYVKPNIEVVGDTYSVIIHVFKLSGEALLKFEIDVSVHLGTTLVQGNKCQQLLATIP